MTTSIPEAPDSGRNWDYRYCWLRDAFFVVRALNSLSEVGTMEDYLRWLNNVVVQRRRRPHPAAVRHRPGARAARARSCAHLAGYRGMGPVRVGNQAQEHFQHDVYGNIVLGAAQAFHDHRLLRRGRRGRVRARSKRWASRPVRVYDQPDAGMWELRTRARVHTSSALMCWAACDRLAKIAATLRPARARRATGASVPTSIRERILREAWSEERQAFAESFGGRDLDASVLLMVEVGFIDPQRPALRRHRRCAGEARCATAPTCAATRRPTTSASPRPPSTSAPSGASTRWRASAARSEAREIFEAMLARAQPRWACCRKTSHPVTGEMWGNFPQTYSMVGIINGAVRLSAPWDDAV